MMKSLLLLLLTAYCCICSAQTKLTFTLDSNTEPVDSIRIYKFSAQKWSALLFKDRATVLFPDKYADLFTFAYFKDRQKLFERQCWIDTGNIRIVIKEQEDHGRMSMYDTIIGSRLTRKVTDFFSRLGDLSHRHDSSVANALLINGYREFQDSPVSFYIGQFYYHYNRNNNLNFIELNSFELTQNREIKKSIFYSMMMADRFRNSERLFIDYFANNSFVTIDGKMTSSLILNSKGYVLLFLDAVSPLSVKEFKAFEAYAPGFTHKNIELIVAVNTAHLNDWKKIIGKTEFRNIFLVDGNLFLSKTLCYPATKFYIFSRRGIPGYYDTFAEMQRHLAAEPH